MPPQFENSTASLFVVFIVSINLIYIASINLIAFNKSTIYYSYFICAFVEISFTKFLAFFFYGRLFVECGL